MLEILFLVSVVLSIVALSKARSTARRLSETIVRFSREIEALKQARPVSLLSSASCLLPAAR